MNVAVVACCTGVYQGLPLISGGSRVVEDDYCAFLINAMSNAMSNATTLGVTTREYEFP